MCVCVVQVRIRFRFAKKKKKEKKEKKRKTGYQQILEISATKTTANFLSSSDHERGFNGHLSELSLHTCIFAYAGIHWNILYIDSNTAQRALGEFPRQKQLHLLNS